MNALFSTAGVARAAGVGLSTVKRWADSGMLVCVRTAGGHRRFALPDVERLVRAQASPTAAAPLELLDLLLGGSAHEIEGALLEARGRLGAWHRVADSLGSVIEEVGRLWRDGHLTVIEEHLASEALARALAAVGDSLPSAKRAPRCLLACADGDEHTLGLSLAELCLREAGWLPLWSGRATPMNELIRRLDKRDLRLVALSASSRSNEQRALERQARRLAVACRAAGAALVLGGRGAWPERPRDAVRMQRFDEFHAWLGKMAS